LAKIIGILNALSTKECCIIWPEVLMDTKIAEKSSLCDTHYFSSFLTIEVGKEEVDEEIFLC